MKEAKAKKRLFDYSAITEQQYLLKIASHRISIRTGDRTEPTAETAVMVGTTRDRHCRNSCSATALWRSVHAVEPAWRRVKVSVDDIGI